jgi:hypothetical protein
LWDSELVIEIKKWHTQTGGNYQSAPCYFDESSNYKDLTQHEKLKDRALCEKILIRRLVHNRSEEFEVLKQVNRVCRANNLCL